VTLAIALDILREARSRRWIIALWGLSTLALVVVALGLRLEVVDGALAATRLFGSTLRTDVRAVDVALRPLYLAVSYIVFYGGALLGIVATADFAPTLLAPGRIEQLLARPVRRWEVLAGTFLGVEALVLAGAAYGGAGVAALLYLKTGILNPGPVVAALGVAVAFAPVYAAMLLSVVVARSAALSGGAGLLLLAAGLVAGQRTPLAELFHEGASRAVFLGLTALLPRLSAIATIGARLAEAQPVSAGPAAALVAGTLAFAFGLLAVAIARFERKDY